MFPTLATPELSPKALTRITAHTSWSTSRRMPPLKLLVFCFANSTSFASSGKLELVTIYELIGKVPDLEQDAAFAEYPLLLREFTAARELYVQRKWSESQDAFQSIFDRWPADGPSRTYWKRCQDYLFDAPPAAWDGVFTMTHK